MELQSSEGLTGAEDQKKKKQKKNTVAILKVSVITQ